MDTIATVVGQTVALGIIFAGIFSVTWCWCWICGVGGGCDMPGVPFTHRM